MRVLRTSSGPIPAGRGRVHDIIGDVREKQLWQQLVARADVIYHLAAQTSVSRAAEDPEASYQHNVLPMLHLLEACRREGRAPSIIFASTATIFGCPDRLPVNESFPDCPPTVYDLHKKFAEDYLKHYARSGLATGAALRFANVYGPGPLAREADRGVLNRMVARALRGEVLTIYGTGEQLRDYTYTDDAVMALAAAARHIEALNGGHFVVGSGQAHTVAQAIQLVASRVSARLGRAVSVSHVEPPASSPAIDGRNFIADPGAFCGATGWSARVPLGEGLDRTIDAALGELSLPVAAARGEP